jgi:hypothetical protein
MAAAMAMADVPRIDLIIEFLPDDGLPIAQYRTNGSNRHTVVRK